MARLKMRELVEFTEQARISKSMDDLFDKFRLAVLQTEFESIAFGNVKAEPGLLDGRFERSSHVTFPKEWVTLYYEKSLGEQDPILQNAFQMTSVQTWQDLLTNCNATSEQKSFMGRASEFGLRMGVTIPLRRAFGSMYICSLAKSVNQQPSFQTICLLNSLAHVFAIAQERLLFEARKKKTSEILTQRQTECLFWIAQGKSSWDVSRIISVSENTVNYHVKEAMRRLETSSRISAVAKCTRLGLL